MGQNIKILFSKLRFQIKNFKLPFFVRILGRNQWNNTYLLFIFRISLKFIKYLKYFCYFYYFYEKKWITIEKLNSCRYRYEIFVLWISWLNIWGLDNILSYIYLYSIDWYKFLTIGSDGLYKLDGENDSFTSFPNYATVVLPQSVIANHTIIQFSIGAQRNPYIDCLLINICIYAHVTKFCIKTNQRNRMFIPKIYLTYWWALH